MKLLLLLILLGVKRGATVTHSLKYHYYSASFQTPNLPEFVAVGLVDEVQVVYYDSKTRRAKPLQDWMSRITDPQYWEKETGRFTGAQQAFKANIEIAKQRFNQTGGVHIFQTMYGCEWDAGTEEVTGIYKFCYDGEAFISFDLEEQTWITTQQQAVITKHKWDSQTVSAQKKNYLTQVCPEWLKKYLNEGNSSLLRTVLPSVCLLQKSPSSPVSCHATGFYPDRATMFWRKDGEETHEDVDHGEILPNHDGTFQMTVDLRVKDLEKYECVFQLSGLKNDIITKLDKAEIRINKEKENSMSLIIIIIAVAVLVAIVAVIGFVLYKRKTKQPPSPPSCVDGVTEHLNPR